MTSSPKLWLSTTADRFYLIPVDQEFFAGIVTITDIWETKRQVSIKQIAPFEVNKETAHQQLKIELQEVLNTALSQTAQNFKTDPNRKLAEFLQPLLAKNIDLTDSNKLEKTISEWVDNHWSKEESVESILQKITELIPKEQATTKEQAQSLQQAIKDSNPSGIAAFLHHFLDLLATAPNLAHEQFFSQLNLDEQLTKKLKLLPVSSIKDFNKDLAKYVSELADALQKPLAEIDLDQAVQKFEASIYVALRVEHPDIQREKRRKKEYNKLAKNSIQNSLKKSSYTSFADFRKKNNPPK